MPETSPEARFSIGELVHHKLFGYRGVVFDVDPVFSGSEEWYQQVARSRPPKDRPWYHVLPHGAQHHTYVAERNLESDDSNAAIDHPAVDYYFERLENGVYMRRRRTVH
ncbi:MAG: heat shock protein HspQ [Acidobacteriia bacterium]|nr:heat shock protein HspQ [Terriglobia bacterium]